MSSIATDGVHQNQIQFTIGQLFSFRFRQVNWNTAINEDIFCGHHHIAFFFNRSVHGNHRYRRSFYIIILHILVLLEILHLLHYLAEHFWSVLWRIAMLDKTNLDVLFQLVTNALVIEPIGKGRFCINNLSNLACKTLTLIIDYNTIYLLIFSVFEVVLVS